MWIFCVGSHLYKLSDEFSDLDFLSVSSHGNLKCDDIFPEQGPTPLKKEKCDVRRTSFELLRQATLNGSRWAWEAWLQKPLTSDVQWEHLQELLIKSKLNEMVLKKGYERYKQSFLPETLATKPRIDRADTVEWFSQSGWNHKVGYYLLLSSYFVLKFPNISFTEEEKSFLVALKRGKVQFTDWKNTFDNHNAKIDTINIFSNHNEHIKEWNRLMKCQN